VDIIKNKDLIIGPKVEITVNSHPGSMDFRKKALLAMEVGCSNVLADFSWQGHPANALDLQANNALA
jgi:hypothetical protein